jgi:hypothetical protein
MQQEYPQAIPIPPQFWTRKRLVTWAAFVVVLGLVCLWCRHYVVKNNKDMERLERDVGRILGHN